jgi:hypothetical protein
MLDVVGDGQNSITLLDLSQRLPAFVKRARSPICIIVCGHGTEERGKFMYQNLEPSRGGLNEAWNGGTRSNTTFTVPGTRHCVMNLVIQGPQITFIRFLPRY